MGAPLKKPFAFANKGKQPKKRKWTKSIHPSHCPICSGKLRRTKTSGFNCLTEDCPVSIITMSGEIKYDSILSTKKYIREWKDFPLDLKLFADIKTTEQMEMEDMSEHGWKLNENGFKVPL